MKKNNKLLIIRIVISCFAIGVIVCREIFPGFIKFDSITIGFLIAAFLPWLSTFLQSMELPGGWKIQFKKLKKENVKMKNEIRQLKYIKFNETDVLKWAKEHNVPDPYNMGPKNFEKCLFDLEIEGGKNNELKYDKNNMLIYR